MMDSSRPPWLPLGSLLVRERLITTEQLEVALLEQQQLNWRLGEILVNWGWVTSREIAFALAEQYGLGFLDLTKAEIDEEAAMLMSPDVARSYHALPVRFLPDGVLLVAIADPTDVGAAEQLREELGRPVRLAVADETDLSLTVERIYKLVA